MSSEYTARDNHLMKVSRSRYQRTEQRAAIFQPLRDDVQHFAFALHFAVDENQPRLRYRSLIALDQFRPDDDVGVAGLVFEREEDHAFGGVRMLAANDDAGGAGART